MIIEISDDWADEIVKKSLLEDYISLTEDLEHPELMHEDDVEAFIETVEAIKSLSNWYFVNGEFQKAVKKARKKK